MTSDAIRNTLLFKSSKAFTHTHTHKYAHTHTHTHTSTLLYNCISVCVTVGVRLCDGVQKRLVFLDKKKFKIHLKCQYIYVEKTADMTTKQFFSVKVLKKFIRIYFHAFNCS